MWGAPDRTHVHPGIGRIPTRHRLCLLMMRRLHIVCLLLGLCADWLPLHMHTTEAKRFEHMPASEPWYLTTAAVAPRIETQDEAIAPQKGYHACGHHCMGHKSNICPCRSPLSRRHQLT